ncbi:MAG TPA: PAS domain-containing protein, partial [Tepidisphaeraceae bacterium]|nr:PAS domain-containing protein [Tepidisphaeraceae bacterium]
RKFENEPQTITLRFERTGVVSRCEIFQSGNTFVLLALDQSDVQNHLDEIERALASERRLLDALPMRLIRVDSNGKLVWSNRAGAAGDLPDLETALANNGSTENQTLPNGVELQPIERSSSTTAFALIDRRDERDTRRRVSRFDALESLINNDPPLALLELDLQTGVTTANNSARDLLKLAADVPIVLTELCMPVDRIAVERAFYGGGHTEKDRIDFEFHLDSTGQKLRAVGQVFFDHDNGTAVPIGAIARLVDTERERIPSVERNPITTALFESIEGAVRIYMPDTVRQNGAAIRLFGIDEVNWRDVDAWHARHNPRDAQGNSIAPNALPAQAAIRGESLNLEMVIDTPHGARFVRSSVTPIFIDQQVVGCVCIDIDQTDESDQRQKLESLETRLNEQIDATRAASAETARIVDQLGTVRAEWIAQLPAPIVQLDLDGRLQHANASALRLLGIESGTEWLFQNFEWFDAQDRPISADDLLALFRRVEPNSIPLHAKDPRRSHMLWLELQSAQSADGITLLLRDRSREVSAMASLSQLQTRINEISSEAESRRLRMLGDHHALVTLIQIMCADVDSVAQPLALDRRL